VLRSSAAAGRWLSGVAGGATARRGRPAVVCTVSLSQQQQRQWEEFRTGAGSTSRSPWGVALLGAAAAAGLVCCTENDTASCKSGTRKFEGPTYTTADVEAHDSPDTGIWVTYEVSTPVCAALVVTTPRQQHNQGDTRSPPCLVTLPLTLVDAWLWLGCGWAVAGLWLGCGCWFARHILQDGVYDITQFVADHPGGSEKIMMAAGVLFHAARMLWVVACH